MTSEQARQILIRYRPGTADIDDPEVREALDLAGQDAGLRRWLEAQGESHAAIRDQFRNLPVPAGLKERLLETPQNIVRPSWQRWRLSVAAAAAAMLVLGGVAVLFLPPATPTFENFTDRMVGMVLRSYGMEILTDNPATLRAYAATNGAPHEFPIPLVLTNLTLTGGSVFTWKDRPVSMACFDRGDGGMLFLFVMHRADLPDSPVGTPATSVRKNLKVVEWRQDRYDYLLIGPSNAEFSGERIAE